MRRFILTLTCALALVVSIGLGVSAASNGKGLGELRLGTLVSTLTGTLGTQAPETEQPEQGNGDDSQRFTATTFEFDPDRTRTVVAAWIKHLGLPQNDPDRFGLILSKNTLTPTNAAPGLSIHGVRGIHLHELGFDVRNGGHCGAGAPRFNVVASDQPTVTRFYGCVYGTHTPATPQAGWQRVRFFTNVDYPGAPAIPNNATILSISVVFDEGVDAGPDLSGMVVLDNIDINGSLIGRPGSSDKAAQTND